MVAVAGERPLVDVDTSCNGYRNGLVTIVCLTAGTTATICGTAMTNSQKPWRSSPPMNAAPVDKAKWDDALASLSPRAPRVSPFLA